MLTFTIDWLLPSMNRKQWASRPGRESLSKRLGALAERIKERDGYACVYCGATAQSSGAPLHLDHVVTKGMGGATVPENLVCACRRCNSSRKIMSVEAWELHAVSLGVWFDPKKVRRQAKKRLPEK